MNEIIFMIQELNQQQSLFMTKIRYCAKLLQEYFQMAKAAVEAAGLAVDFSRMESQIGMLQKMQKLVETEHELESIFEVPEDGTQGQDNNMEIHISVEKLCDKVAKLEARDREVQQLINDVQQFDETLRFDETYEDIMAYVSRLKKGFADYQMVSTMVRDGMLKLREA